MRFARVLASPSLTNAVLQSLGCGALAFVVTVIITQTSYESVVVLEQKAMSRGSAQELSRAVKNSNTASTVKLSTNFVAPNQLQVSCRAEQVRDAEAACERAANAATARSSSVRVLRTSAGDPTPDNITLYAALSAALALTVLVGRLFQLDRARRRAATQELAELWTVKRQSSDDDDAKPQPIAPSFRAPTQPQLESQSTDLSTRVIFRVGGNPHKPDNLVLTERTLERLRQLASQLQARDERMQVIRVASSVSSRYAKTQIAAQLAAVLAEADETRVVVAEGDIDAPALHKVMKLEAPLGLGFSEQLQRLSGQQGRGTLSVMRVAGNLHALLESRIGSPSAFALPLYGAALEELRKSHRFVVVDGPVVDTWPDSTHLASGVDVVVWVTAAGTRTRDSMALASRHFDLDQLLHIDATDDWVAAG